MSLWSRLERKLGDLAGELVLDDYRDQLNQARALLAKGELPQAIESLEALLAAKPDHGQALILLGEARLAQRDPHHAQEAFERALALRGGDPAGLVGLGLSLIEMARYEPAAAALTRAIHEAGGDRAILADAYRGLGVAWRRRGDLDKAIRELRKAVVEDAEDSDARAALGEALVTDGGPYDEAARHLERAMTLGASALALYGLGRLALVEDTPAKATELLARAREASNGDPTPLGAQQRLEILIGQGDAALAEHDAMRAHVFFLEALQLDPKRSELHARIAATHRSIGNLDAALASYDRVLALDPSWEVLRAAVETAIAAGDVTRAAQWGNDLLAKDPNDPRALVARGMAMAKAQPDVARALLQLAAARDDVDAYVELAKLALDEPAKAATYALAALRVAPTHAKARDVLATARAAELGFTREQRDIAETCEFMEHAVASRRELGHHVGEIARAAASLDQPLLVTVMGEFSSGKSSFVNAFIGADVAPTGITPTTATINVVRYGRERGGRIIASDGAVTELGWDALMAHLRALTPAEARAIDRVEILVPLPQLEKINIVDTPGLNSIQPEHEATARAFIAKADAVVWIFTASQGGKASEKKALQSIRDEGKRVLGVLNKADQLSADERKEVVDFITGELVDLGVNSAPSGAAASPEQARSVVNSAPSGAAASPEQARSVVNSAPSGAAASPEQARFGVNSAPLSGAADSPGQARLVVNSAPPSGAAASPGQARLVVNSTPPSGAADSPGQARLVVNPAPPSGAADSPGQARLVVNPAPPSGAADSPGQARLVVNPAPPSGAADSPGQARLVVNPSADSPGQGGLVETIVPVSAREAMADRETGNWPALIGALEERFFQQARALKRDACARVLRGVIAQAQATLEAGRSQESAAAAAAHAGRDELEASARAFADQAVVAERKELSDQMVQLYRRAAREVLDLVRPRRLPFSSHTATAADREYLLALLSSGFESAIEGGKKRVAADLARRSRAAEAGARALGALLGTDVVGDLERVATDRIGLAMARVFDRARAYLRGYLEGGYVDSFFRNDVPRLELSEDAIYHALYRSAPDLDHEIGEPLEKAAVEALHALAARLEHWSAVADVQAFDLDVGISRALELAAARLRD